MKRTRRNFTAEEDAFLLARWPHHRLHELATMMSREQSGVSKRAHWLGLPHKPRQWAGNPRNHPAGNPRFGDRNRAVGEVRDALLLEEWNIRTPEWFAAQWNVTVRTVRRRARRLGLI